MFHARFDGCLVLKLIRILTLTQMLNFDINVDRRTENRTPISHPATSRCDKNKIECCLLQFCMAIYSLKCSLFAWVKGPAGGYCIKNIFLPVNIFL